MKNKSAILLGLAAAMMASNPISEQTTNRRGMLDKPQRKQKRFGSAIQLVYPEDATNQQRGFTPAGSAKNHFPIYRRQFDQNYKLTKNI